MIKSPSWACVCAGSNAWFILRFHGNLSAYTDTDDRVSNHKEILLKTATQSLSLALHINGVISEHSVHGESTNKMGQAPLEAGCWLTSISSYPRALFPYYYREPLDKQINKPLPLGSDTKPSDHSTGLLWGSLVELSFIYFLLRPLELHRGWLVTPHTFPQPLAATVFIYRKLKFGTEYMCFLRRCVCESIHTWLNAWTKFQLL